MRSCYHIIFTKKDKSYGDQHLYTSANRSKYLPYPNSKARNILSNEIGKKSENIEESSSEDVGSLSLTRSYSISESEDSEASTKNFHIWSM
jgi:hypothetical protein